uniref:Uncharacterized protein n=1 Tax=Anguilla anguilla TaxID=7936 RepID=A0A0E9UPC4_ANGAN
MHGQTLWLGTDIAALEENLQHPATLYYSFELAG